MYIHASSTRAELFFSILLFTLRRVVHGDQYSISEKTKCESISNKSMLLCSEAFEGGSLRNPPKSVKTFSMTKDDTYMKSLA